MRSRDTLGALTRMASPAALPLEGRVALVTGAGSGFGQAIAVRFAECGARVAVADNNLPGAKSTYAMIAAAGGAAMAIGTDVTLLASVQTAVGRTVDQLGGLDIMVNCAGVNVRQKFLDVTELGWDHVMAVNLTGVFHGVRAAAERMIPAKSGCIINMSSIREDVGGFSHTAYCASKGGVRMLTRAAAVELAPFGIRVCAIGPGVSRTPLTRPLLENVEVYDQLLARIPAGRFGETDDIAEAAVFLASSDASYITGTTLMVDGGELTH